MSLKGQHIVLGVTGSIAAYKAVQLLRLLLKEGAEVRVIMTPAAKAFVGPLSFSTLSQAPVISEFFDKTDGSWHSHVDLGLWADVFLVAPATAATLSKMAYGVADNMLITSYLSTRGSVWIAPAMDLDMYSHMATQKSIRLLKEQGCHLIEPETGFLASGLQGKGRMPEPERIVEVLREYFDQQPRTQQQYLTGKKILITSGPTREKIDPVRYISNYSSGKMGAALAEAAHARGASVCFITGPAAVMPCPSAVEELIEVESALEMQQAVEQYLDEETDIAIFCAAVADYRPVVRAQKKIKREGSGELNLSLRANPDIAAEAAKRKSQKQFFLGFALETDHDVSNAQKKMKSKGLDAIVLNHAGSPEVGFGADTNEVQLLSPDGRVKHIPLQSKAAVAEAILEELFGPGRAES